MYTCIYGEHLVDDLGVSESSDIVVQVGRTRIHMYIGTRKHGGENLLDDLGVSANACT